MHCLFTISVAGTTNVENFEFIGVCGLGRPIPRNPTSAGGLRRRGGPWQTIRCAYCSAAFFRSVMRRALIRSDSLILDGLNQVRVIVSAARDIDALRYGPHAQKVIWRGPQELGTSLSD